MGINDEMEEIGGVEEGMMPVFTVLKDGRVLKNIFLNEPPPEQEQGSPMRPRGEEKILVGRHPECHIVVDHPSISRFHLEIRVQASSRRISVVDLSSVHGTWISGNRLQPQVAMDLAEGDTMRIGASSRIYELHWIPQRTAFELDNHLVALPEARSLNHQARYSVVNELSCVLLYAF
ncbi:unnamed protein product [Spirodela intermedia]|uniref:FHA domain-containing protein n=1 Tax=Spirodela intermedia TaxID=51605 RepID=A0A7I8KR73_SPIIN|nr:unnamed protein product [Spirodela intermedia]